MTRSDVTLLVGRGRLFVVSYAPLALMFAARFAAQDSWKLAAGFGLVGVVGLVDGFRLVRGARQLSKRTTQITDVSSQGGAVAAYLATYLLPFLGNLPSSWGDWVAYGLYFLTAALVYVRSDLAVVNPTLYALGYQLVSGRMGNRAVLVVSRTEVQSGSHVLVSETMGVVVAHEVWDDPRP